MTRELANARLLNSTGTDTPPLDNPSSCVKRHAARYFLTCVLPPVGADCEQDAAPFTSAAPATGNGPTAAPSPSA